MQPLTSPEKFLAATLFYLFFEKAFPSFLAWPNIFFCFFTGSDPLERHWFNDADQSHFPA